MILIANCKKCHQPEIKVRTLASDRVELAREKGEFFAARCNTCRKTSEYHVDNFLAEPNKLLGIIALLVLFVGTPLAGYFLWTFAALSMMQVVLGVLSFALLPSGFYIVIQRKIDADVRAFNRHRLAGYNSRT